MDCSLGSLIFSCLTDPGLVKLATSKSFLCVFVLSHFSRVWLFVTSWTVALAQARLAPLSRLLCPWDFPGQNTGMVVISFSRGSSQLRIKPVSLRSPTLTGEFFTNSTTWEAPKPFLNSSKLWLSNCADFSRREERLLKLQTWFLVFRMVRHRLW